MSAPTSSEWYDAVYSVLVSKAGAPETYRRDFLCLHTNPKERCDEWRFCGTLGGGGKYWKEKNTVTCYSEDSTPDREQIIAATNAALAGTRTDFAPPEVPAEPEVELHHPNLHSDFQAQFVIHLGQWERSIQNLYRRTSCKQVCLKPHPRGNSDTPL